MSFEENMKLSRGLVSNIHVFKRIRSIFALIFHYVGVIIRINEARKDFVHKEFMFVRTDLSDFYARVLKMHSANAKATKGWKTKINKQIKSPADPPGRDVPGASQEDRPREQQHLPRDRAAGEGQLGTPVGGRGSEPGATVTGAPLPRSATSASAMPLADVDGWS